MKTNLSNPDQPEEIVAMKSRLLAHITHEFLTPLNLIITPLERLLAKESIGEEKKTLALMHRNSQRLLLVISQVLELLKLEAMRLKLKARPTSKPTRSRSGRALLRQRRLARKSRSVMPSW